jgi:hypothetical protein
MVNQNLCTVCGYQMEEPARDYNICPSCGTEFGLHDQNTSIEGLREAWLATGPKWWSATDPEPVNWNPMMQLAGLLLGQAKITVFSNDYGLGITVIQGAAVDWDPARFAYRLS